MSRRVYIQTRSVKNSQQHRRASGSKAEGTVRGYELQPASSFPPLFRLTSSRSPPLSTYEVGSVKAVLDGQLDYTIPHLVHHKCSSQKALTLPTQIGIDFVHRKTKIPKTGRSKSLRPISQTRKDSSGEGIAFESPRSFCRTCAHTIACCRTRFAATSQ